jgi:hypothetical protein
MRFGCGTVFLDATASLACLGANAHRGLSFFVFTSVGFCFWRVLRTNAGEEYQRIFSRKLRDPTKTKTVALKPRFFSPVRK